MKVLTAEDDRASSRLLQKVLERLGHDLVAAANGAEGVEQLARKDDLQVVISDWFIRA
jgi:CheY-like chemotaxis protein